MSTKQKSYLLISLIIVALIMLVTRVGQVIFSLDKSGYISIYKPEIFASEKPAPSPEIAVININDYEEVKLAESDIELSILEDLSYQKEFLEIKRLELEKRDIQLQLVAIELENKMNVIHEAENRLMALVNKREMQNQEDVSHLVKIYTNMNSKDATRIIENLDIDVAILLLKAMDTDTASSILSQMSASASKEITNKLIESTLQRK